MYKDVSQIPETLNCVKIIDNNSLIVYTNDDTKIYKLVGNKYYATESYEPNTPSTETVCYTFEEIQNLPSTFDFITPIYHFMAIVSVILIVYGAYKLILYPFFRKKI